MVMRTGLGIAEMQASSSQSQNKAGGSVGHQDLQASDEWCFTYASIRSWWWYSYRNRIPYRWIQC